VEWESEKTKTHFMQIKIISVPVFGGEDAERELNKFLRGQRILRVEKEFLAAGTDSTWCFCVEFVENAKSAEKRTKSERKDYRKELTPEQVARFANYREIRKRLAKEEGVPAYAIFTNEELAGMAQISEMTIAGLRNVNGIGEKKAGKWGKYFVDETGKGDEA